MEWKLKEVRGIFALIVVVLLVLGGACWAEEMPEVPPVESLAEAAPTPEPALPENPMVLMADPQQATTLEVGGLFSSGATVLGSELPRESIVGIRFENTIFAAPDDAWDVSADRNFSVLAWVRDGELIIAGEGGVWANPDSSGLFAGYSALESVDFNGCFHLELAEDLSHLFEGDWSLRALDLSGMPTPRAVDFSYMFNSCASLQSLDLSGLYTGNAARMEGMFLLDASLEELDLSGFDLRSAKQLMSMFEGCASLRALQTGGLELSGAEDLRRMFYGCAALAELHVDGSYPADAETDDMFTDCPARLLVGDVQMNAEDWAELGARIGLRRGASGDAVRWLQNKLLEAGYDLGAADGAFGPATEAALISWQTVHGFEPTGETDEAQVLELLDAGA